MKSKRIQIRDLINMGYLLLLLLIPITLNAQSTGERLDIIQQQVEVLRAELEENGNENNHEYENSEQLPDDSFFNGWWDAFRADNTGMNIKKVDDSQINDFDGEKIVMVSGFRNLNKDQIRRRIEGRASLLNNRDDIRYIILMDEPFYKGMSPENIKYMCEVAQQAFDAPIAVTLARGEVNNRDNHIPSCFDAISINFYIQYHRDYPSHWVDNEDDFNAHLKGSLNRIAERGYQGEIFLVGQAFYSDPERDRQNKYRKPSLDSVDWYVNAIRRYGLEGILWFEWRSRGNWFGAEEMPELVEKIRGI